MKIAGSKTRLARKLQGGKPASSVRNGKFCASVDRITTETQIHAQLRLYGRGEANIATGIGFLDHMIALFAKHGGFNLSMEVHGDLNVDQHHSVEDAGIVLGQLFAQALGDRRGINRAGYFVMTMDETLAVAALDLGGRPFLAYSDLVRVRRIGDFEAELAEDFFRGFAVHAGANLHLKVLYGRSSHHKLEALFKCFARALKYACSRDLQLGKALPSTKGLL
jgi:imidazoleglycerol-phosphate dehydratase